MSAEGTVVQAEPYHVEARGGCGTCGAGRLFDVVGPDGVAQGISFDQEVDAEEYAGALSGAYWKGHEAGRQEATIVEGQAFDARSEEMLAVLEEWFGEGRGTWPDLASTKAALARAKEALAKARRLSQ